MRVLGLETTCDESAAAVVALDQDGRGTILSNEILEPDRRARRLRRRRAGDRGARPRRGDRPPRGAGDAGCAGIELDDLDGIAAAAGPGLIGGVIVGLTTAKALALVARKPLIAVNHLEGARAHRAPHRGLAFPYLLLLVSGGHTQLVAVRGVGDYVRLGTTVDDAVGEAFDKVAKMLGLPYPGGPEVEREAQRGDPDALRSCRAR